MMGCGSSGAAKSDQPTRPSGRTTGPLEGEGRAGTSKANPSTENPALPPTSSSPQAQTNNRTQHTASRERAAGSSPRKSQSSLGAADLSREKGTQGDSRKVRPFPPLSADRPSPTANRVTRPGYGPAKEAATAAGAVAAAVAAIDAGASAAASTVRGSRFGMTSAQASDAAAPRTGRVNCTATSPPRSSIPGVSITRGGDATTISAGPNDIVIVAPARMFQGGRGQNPRTPEARAVRPINAGDTGAFGEHTGRATNTRPAANDGRDSAFAKAYRAFFEAQSADDESAETAALVKVGFPVASIELFRQIRRTVHQCMPLLDNSVMRYHISTVYFAISCMATGMTAAEIEELVGIPEFRVHRWRESLTMAGAELPSEGRRHEELIAALRLFKPIFTP